MHEKFPYMFDCWVDPVVHLYQPKSSMHSDTVTILHFAFCSWSKVGEERLKANGHAILIGEK